MKIVKRAAWWVATGLGLGYSPVASGTVGSLWGVALVYAVFPHLNLPGQIVLAAVCALVSIPICELAERQAVKKDDGRIVADEFLTFPLCVLGLWPALSAPGGWRVMALAFVVCRMMDIIKPFPARRLQDLHGGLGITIDDVIASLYALAVNHALVRWLFA